LRVITTYEHGEWKVVAGRKTGQLYSAERVEFSMESVLLLQADYMQDYMALGFPDLLENYIDCVRMQIGIMQKEIIKKHCEI
jgi:hypothetical protein